MQREFERDKIGEYGRIWKQKTFAIREDFIFAIFTSTVQSKHILESIEVRLSCTIQRNSSAPSGNIEHPHSSDSIEWEELPKISSEFGWQLSTTSNDYFEWINYFMIILQSLFKIIILNGYFEGSRVRDTSDLAVASQLLQGLTCDLDRLRIQLPVHGQK